MAVRAISDRWYTVLYCSTTMQPLSLILDADEDWEGFLEWLPMDARAYSDKDLNNKYYEWREYEKNDST